MLAMETELATLLSERLQLMTHIILARVNPRQASSTLTHQTPIPSASQRPHILGATSSGGADTGTSQEYGTTSDRHPVRDAAAVGTGVGALGAGADEYERLRAPPDPTPGGPTE